MMPTGTLETSNRTVATGRAGRWIRVTSGSPCPICESDSHCSIADDKPLVICMKKESAEIDEKSGGFYHWTGPRPERQRRSESIDLSGIESSPELASIEIRHQVYSRLIENLPTAYQMLCERKLPAKEFRELGYRKLEKSKSPKIAKLLWAEFGEVLLSVPGFVIAKKRDGSRFLTISGRDGLIIPVRNVDGLIGALKNRADKAPNKGSRYRAITSSDKRSNGPSPGSPAHVPLGTPRNHGELRITEGEIKADAASVLSKTPTISVPGVQSWQKAVGIVDILQPKSIAIAFDADCSTNKDVAKALLHLTEALIDKGYPVTLETWDPADGKGIDDLLIKGMAPTRISGDELFPAIRKICELAGVIKSSGSESGAVATNPESSDSFADIPDDWVCNGVPNGDEETIPLLLPQILARIKRAAGDWPRKAGMNLFVHNEGTDDPVKWLKKPDALFSHLGMIAKRPPKFYNNPGFQSKSEVFIAAWESAKKYEAIETTPHEPLVQDHYYACEPIEPTPQPAIAADSFDPSAIEKIKPSKMDQFLDRFDFYSDVDRSLALAMLATIIWGGRGGSRPMFVITSKHGRGAGKSTMVQIFGDLVGGIMEFAAGETTEAVKKRLLSPIGRKSRICRIDNLKTHRFSNAELEGMITSPRISGHEMFEGEGTRPNLLTWIATVNGFNASTDIAQRSVVIFINPPKYSGDWTKDTTEFAETNRKEILADLIAFLRREQAPMSSASRWGEWERCVLSRLPDYELARTTMLQRQSECDVESSEDDILGDFLFSTIHELGYSESDRVFIPNLQMAKWSAEAMQEKAGTSRVNSALKQRIEEGKFNYLAISPSRAYGRGYYYFRGHESNGTFGGLKDYDQRSDKTHYDVEERIRQNKINLDAETRAEVIRKSS